jgi:hypothetical protein
MLCNVVGILWLGDRGVFMDGFLLAFYLAFMDIY